MGGVAGCGGVAFTGFPRCLAISGTPAQSNSDRYMLCRFIFDTAWQVQHAGHGRSVADGIYPEAAGNEKTAGFPRAVLSRLFRYCHAILIFFQSVCGTLWF